MDLKAAYRFVYTNFWLTYKVAPMIVFSVFGPNIPNIVNISKIGLLQKTQLPGNELSETNASATETHV